VILVLLVTSCSGKDEPWPEKLSLENIKLETGEFVLPSFRNVMDRLSRYSHSYRIHLSVNRDLARAEGIMEISWFNSSAINLPELQFRLLTNQRGNAPLSILSVKGGESDLPFTISEDKSTLTVALPAKLTPGHTADLTILYELDFSTPPVYYFNFARIDDNGFSIPYFYPVASRIVRGEWETDTLAKGGDLLSAESSRFYVEVETDRDVTIIASGREEGEWQAENRQRKAFTAGPVRDFYICALKNPLILEGESGETRIASYSSREHKAASQRAISAAKESLRLLGEEFGTYPFAELKILSLPTSALGIEFPGLIVLKEELYDNPDGNLFEPTVVHEVAHQWFYSLLGNNQLRAPWIDEGLAQYSLWLYYHRLYGSLGGEAIIRSFEERLQRVENRTLSIGKKVSAYRGTEYGAIIYGRAPLFFLDLRELMGEEALHSFLRQLLEDFSGRVLDGETFLESIMEITGGGADSIIGEYFD